MELINIRKSYSNKKVIDELSVKILENNQITGLIGKNGSGKTTLLKVLQGNIVSYQGEIEGIEEQRIFSLIESPKLFTNKSGWYNIKYFSQVFSLYNKKYIDEIIETLGIKEFLEDKVSNYSMGMKQLLAIAISLSVKPDILILDEPTNGMDVQFSKKTLSTLKNITSKYNIKTIITSHKIEEIESICEVVLILKNGKIVENISVKELKVNKIFVYFKTEDIEKAKQLLQPTYQINHNNPHDHHIEVIYTKDYSDLFEILGNNEIFPIKIEQSEDNLKNHYLKIYDIVEDTL